jgi:molybdopterin converting factor small subunit
MVSVFHGGTGPEEVDVAGQTLGGMKDMLLTDANLKQRLNIPEDVAIRICTVNGEQQGNDYVLSAGDKVNITDKAEKGN